MYDALVVGGGIVGASTAYHLARTGAETLLIDRDDDGRATDAGAGIVSPATSSRTGSDPWFDFAIDAAEYYPELIDDLEGGGYETDYARCGLLSVAVSKNEREPYRRARERIADRRERIGYPKREIVEFDAEEARERFPPLASGCRALYVADAARIDGQSVTDALLSAASERGLTVERASAERISTGQPVTVATDGGDRFEAESAVIAGGAWSAAFGEQLGTAIPVEPERGQIVHLDVDAPTVDWPIAAAVRGHYAVPWPGGRVAVGATREADSGFDPRVTAGGVREVLDEALRVAPGLADAAIDEVRVGLRPVSADRLPVLGAVPGADSIYVATGHGATGLQLGPYSGKCVADLVREDDPPSDLAPFSIERF